MHASGVIWCVPVYGVKECTYSIIRLQFGSGNVYSVRHMCISDIMLWVNVDRSVLALIGRALCFHFVSGAVVVLLLQYYTACMISRVLWHIWYGIAEAGVYYPHYCRYCCTP